MIITRFISSTIESLKRTLTVNGRGKYDPRTANECVPHGTDSSPVKDMDAVYLFTENSDKRVVVGYINKHALAKVGENRQYATDSDGVVTFNAWLRNGHCLIGTSEDPTDYIDNFVRYTPLESALTSYFGALNSAITAGVASAGGAYTPPVTPFNMTASKIEEVKSL
jgi:hypothetical protein